MVTEKQLILETTGSHLPKSCSPEQVAGPAFLRASTVSAVSYQIMFNNPTSSTKKKWNYMCILILVECLFYEFEFCCRKVLFLNKIALV